MKSLLRTCQLALALACSLGLATAQSDSTSTGACPADAGALSAVDPQPALADPGVSLEATRTSPVTVPDGYEVAYVLTYEEGGKFIIGDVYESLAEAFVSDANVYRLHTLVAELSDPSDANYLDLSVVEFGTTGARAVLDLVAEAGICAALELPGARFDVTECDVTGGLVFSQNGTNEIALCAASDAELEVRPSYEVTASFAYVVTDANYSILSVSPALGSLSFGEYEPGVYNVFGVTYTGELDVDVSGSVYEQVYSDGCFQISDNEVIVTVDVAGSGEVVLTEGGGTEVYVCDAGDGVADVIGFSNPGASALSYAYVITDAEGIVLSVSSEAYADFDGAAPGVCNVYGLSYSGQLLLSAGDDISDAEYSTGCAELSSDAITVYRSATEGGSVSVGGSTAEIAIDSSSESASVLVEAAGTDAESDYAYFLLDEGLNVVSISADGAFDFSSRASGKYFVYGLAYTGELLLAEGDAFFEVNPEATGCDDVSDNAIVIVVGAGSPADDGGDDECEGAAGTLTALNPADTLDADVEPGVRLETEVTEAPVVPDGYGLFYVLTSPNDAGELVIEDLYTSLREAYVLTAGTYRLHTLVVRQDDATDAELALLGQVEFGVTPAAGVLAIVERGNLCASLELPGAEFVIAPAGTVADDDDDDEDEGEPAPPATDSCDISAGTLSADLATVALDGGVAVLTASVDTAASYRGSLQQVFVLTQGDDLEIVNASRQPGFEVGAPGTYRIHVLVADAGEVAKLDAFAIGAQIVGRSGSTGAELLAFVDAIELCADLSAGAAIEVTGEGMGDACLADAGTVSAVADSITVAEGGVTVAAEVATAPTVPLGSSLAYVLTAGDELTVLEIGLEPSFSVDSTGTYRVHPLVAPNLGTPELLAYFNDLLSATTVTAGVVVGILDATGLCYSLDAAGAPVVVAEEEADEPDEPTTPPADGCPAFAGTLTANASTVDLGGDVAVLTATFDSPASEFENKSQVFLLTRGDDLVIAGASFEAAFTVTTPGTYRIHSFVSDRTGLSDVNVLSLVQSFSGGLDAATVLGLVDQFDICADLSAGVAVEVTGEGPGVTCTLDAGTLEAEGASAVSLDGGSATLSAVVATAAAVPAGYVQAYLLTSGAGNTVRAIAAEPSFDVVAAGDYAIHSLVLPNVVSQTIVDYVNGLVAGFPIGVSTIVSTLNGGSELCYDIDLAGASFSVTEPMRNSNDIDVDFETRPSELGVFVSVAPKSTGQVARDVTVSLTDYAGRTVAVRHLGDVRAATSVNLPSGQSSGAHAVTVQSSGGLASENVVLE